MKTFFKLTGRLVLFFFSFFYTEKVINVITEQDEIMIKIKENEEKNNIPSTNAIIDKNTITPGLSGKEINIDKSYKEMKKLGTYNENMLVYTKVLPEVSINNNKNKYIRSGNKNFTEVSLIFKINKNTDLQKLLTLLDKNNTKANFFISYEYLEKHINEIEKEKNIEYYNYGKNGTYNDEIILIANNIISKKSNPANICLTETNTNNTLKICSENEQFTIYPEIINGTINSIKSKINNGSIISFEVTNTTLNELPLIINYINSKGYTISLLSELINEEK